MTAVAVVLTALVALIHVYIVVLEMVLWNTPRGRAAFGTTPARAAATSLRLIRPKPCGPPMV